ncbi:hypothetical protein DY000_02007337 [Brassica cretica]|uniref:Uncharacterized protein n=1 Tax=Brassica cretica TaxID=69181 RepID=A0ABQ7C375_BRACR|nr:hypothetical protein DY000_02007337 [Brassica cretica]
MSFGGSHWCRSASDFKHRSTDFNQNRSTGFPEHQSMTPSESAASCNAVRIMTQEEFTARHPHALSPVYVKIDRKTEPAIDRHRETATNRQLPAPIDRRASLTYRDATEPMEVDKAPIGRTLKKRKEKVAKHLKRGANEKEMENFRKRVLRIPLEKPFEEAYFTHILWMFFRETRETEEDIRRMFYDARDKMKNRITLKKKSDPGKFAIPCMMKGAHEELSETLRAFLSTVGAVCNMQTNQLCLTHIDPHVNYEPIPVIKPQTSSGRIDDPGLIATCHCGAEYETNSPDIWENDYYNPTLAVHTVTPSARATLHIKEYDEDYEEERAPDCRGIRAEEDRLLHHSYQTRNATSIDITVPTSIDTHHHQTNHKRVSTDIPFYTSIDDGIDRAQEGNYSLSSWADDRHSESYAVETTPKCRPHTRPSIDIDVPTSIDRRAEFGKRAYNHDGTRRFHWDENDEYEVYRDDHGHARDVDGHIIHVSDDIRYLLERASMDEHSYLCLPEHARSFIQTKLIPEIYTKDEINEMLYGIYGAQEKNEDNFQMKIDGVYYPLNDSIIWLTTCMEMMRQDIARMQTHRAAEATTPASIDRNLPTSIDNDPSQSNPMKSQPDSYTRAEIDCWGQNRSQRNQCLKVRKNRHVRFYEK